MSANLLKYDGESFVDEVFGMAEVVRKEDIQSPGAYMDCRDCKLTDELLMRDNDETPDYLQLKQRQEHLLFVYGLEKAGGPLHPIIKDFPTLGDAHTATKAWVMRTVDNGKVPIAMASSVGQDATSGKVLGEVYVVPPELFLELDRLYGNNTRFVRDTRWIWLADQTLKTQGPRVRPSARCWMYIGHPSWVHQQSSSLCVRKESGANGMIYEKYYDWENPKTQLSTMQSIWDKHGVKRPSWNGPDSPLKYTPFHSDALPF